MTKLFLNFIVSAVLTLAVAETDVRIVAGVVNSGAHADVDTDSDVLNDAVNLGPGRFLPGPGFMQKDTIQ